MNFRERLKGAFELIFQPQNKVLREYFKMLDGYTPIFGSYDGGVYEMELTRSCIHAFAIHASKLMPNVTGADLQKIQFILDGKPNPFMVSTQFLYKVATIYETKNTCWIIPILDKTDYIVGYYPVNPELIEIVQSEDGTPWVRFTFGNNVKGAMELERCGVVSKYLYKNDLQGEDNSALNPTLRLLAVQNQGIAEGIKNSASFRFMAKVANFSKAKDLKRERQEFSADNLGPDSGGLLLFPNTYTDIQQVKANVQIVDPEQMKIIQTRVYNYFGCNEEILQNKCVGDAWEAYYEGKIEPFAVQLSQTMTCMTFTTVEQHRGNRIIWSSNRLQYMSNADKLQTSSQMFDRGVFSLNMIMDIWNLPHVEGGDKRYIRKEYAEITELSDSNNTNPEPIDNNEGGQGNGNT